MALSLVTLTFEVQDAGDDAGTGSVTIAPTSVVTAAGQTVVSQVPVVRAFSGGTASVSLVACDNDGTTPAAGFWAYNITLPGGTAQPYLVNYSGGSTQRFDNLSPAVASVTYGPAAGAGGFSNPMTTLGDIMYENATPAAARLAGDTSNTRKFLRTQASAGVAQAPAWDTIEAGDLSAAFPWQFYVPAPSGGDDTSAINTAITNAMAYAAANDYYAEVIFQAGVYSAASNPSAGSGAACNAIIPINPVADTGQKMTLVLRGTKAQAALYHWLQTTPQLGGTMLKTSYAGGTSPTTGNEPSVLGGGTPHNGYGDPGGGPLYSNMHLVIDGIGVSVPQDPEVAGFDFRGIGEVTVISASALARSTGTGAPAIPDGSSGLWAWGMWMPQTNNNDLCDIGQYSCEGFTYGLIIDEHVAATSVRIINCYDGLWVNPQGGFPHGNRFGYLSIENGHSLIVLSGDGKVTIERLDIEWDSGPIVNCQASTVTGEINVGSNGSSGASLSAAMTSGANAVTGLPAGVRIINADMAPGPVSSPAAPPANNAAWLNPYWRDAEVTLSVSGGTLSALKTDAVAEFLPASCTLYKFTVPSGHSYTPTFTGTLTHTVKLL